MHVVWLQDDSLEDADELPEPQDLATEAITELEAVVDDLRDILLLVEKKEGLTTDCTARQSPTKGARTALSGRTFPTTWNSRTMRGKETQRD